MASVPKFQLNVANLPQRPNVKTLVKKFLNIDNALDSTNVDLGSGHYLTARKVALTVSMTPRAAPPARKAKNKAFKQDKVLNELNYLTVSRNETAVQMTDGLGVVIESDQDVAAVMMNLIHDKFYNPETGLWPSYDSKFEASEFTKKGKDGWDAEEESNQREAAREPINREKNKEISRVLKTEFCLEVVESVYEAMCTQVDGIKKREVRHAVRNHVRFHLFKLIYESSKKKEAVPVLETKIARLNLQHIGRKDTVHELTTKFQTLIHAIDKTHADGGAKSFLAAKKIRDVVISTPRRMAPSARAPSVSDVVKPLSGLSGLGKEVTAKEEEVEEAIEELHEEEIKSARENEVDVKVDDTGVIIESDTDLAVVILNLINAKFYDPDFGLWSKYDAEFDRDSFVSCGKPGWDSSTPSNERENARAPINEKKNIEIRKLMGSDFVFEAIGEVWSTIETQVDGVKRREIRHAVRNHIRYHLFNLIFGFHFLL